MWLTGYGLTKMTIPLTQIILYNIQLTGLRPLHLMAFVPPETHHHTFHTAEYHIARNFVGTDPTSPSRRPECSVLLIKYGADYDLSYKGCSLLQQEIYTQEDMSVLNTIVRSSMTLEVRSRV